MSFEIQANHIDITPHTPISLGANGSINKKFKAIDSAIEINAILFKKQDTFSLIISIDTLFVTDELQSIVFDYIKTKISISRHQIYVCASHTHHAPFVDDSKPKLGQVDSHFYQEMIQKLQQLLDDLSTEQISANLEYSQIESKNISISRRKRGWHFRKKIFLIKSMATLPNHDHKIDQTIHLFKWVCNQTNQVLAVIWSFACHPVTYHSKLSVSSHFPGEIRNHIRNKINRDIPIIFLQGFSGDIRPKYTPKPTHLKPKLLKILNSENPFFPFNQKSYLSWISQLTQQMNSLWQLPFQAINPKVICHDQEAVSLTKIMKTRSKQHIQIRALTLYPIVFIFVSAEMVSSYSLELQKKYPDYTIIPVGCTGSVFGYWPNDTMILEKGYEVTGFQKHFSLNGAFKPTVSNPFFQAISKMLCSSSSKKQIL